jgi:phage gp46-like protein
MGLKPGDNETVPLCRKCHNRQHMYGERSFWGDKLEQAHELANALWVMTGDDEGARLQIVRFRRCIST